MTIAIHCEPNIPWQGPFAKKLSEGLGVLGITHYTTHRRDRETDRAILLGTSMWRGIERDGDYLLVDRCSFNDTNKYVSLVWNGHGRRGDHKVPADYDDSRWRTHGVNARPFRGGEQIILCGQMETYSPRWTRVEDWYAAHPEATNFRPHPSETINMTGMPIECGWNHAGLALTLNSSVGVQALIEGVDTRVDDEGGMAYGWRAFGENKGEARYNLLKRLAWTQWHHDEIKAGKPIAHLFD